MANQNVGYVVLRVDHCCEKLRHERYNVLKICQTREAAIHAMENDQIQQIMEWIYGTEDEDPFLLPGGECSENFDLRFDKELIRRDLWILIVEDGIFYREHLGVDSFVWDIYEAEIDFAYAL